MTISCVIALPLLAIAAIPSAHSEAPPPLDEHHFLQGVNLAGAEFGFSHRNTDDEHGRDYIYPVSAFIQSYDEPAFLVEQGIDLFRLPVRWERLQPVLFEPLSSEELGRLIVALEELRDLGAYVVVDVHSYARHRGSVIGTDDVTAAAFADFWARLSAELRPYPEVLLGLMNEPHGLPPGDWVAAANAAIAAIREAGANHVILVPGVRWTGAHSWFTEDTLLNVTESHRRLFGEPMPPLSNSEALLNVVDPLNRYVIEVHQYLDHDSSGRSEACITPDRAAGLLDPFTAWLHEHDLRAFLGEIGVPNTENCLEAFDAVLDDLRNNRDRYIGIAYWAVGPWWPDDYIFLLERGNPADPRLQMLLAD